MSIEKSDVSQFAFDHTVRLMRNRKMKLRLACKKTDETFHYKAGTMSSYFSKLGTKARKRKNLFFPTTSSIEERIRAGTKRSNKL